MRAWCVETAPTVWFTVVLAEPPPQSGVHASVSVAKHLLNARALAKALLALADNDAFFPGASGGSLGLMPECQGYSGFIHFHTLMAILQLTASYLIEVCKKGMLAVEEAEALMDLLFCKCTGANGEMLHVHNAACFYGQPFVKLNGLVGRFCRLKTSGDAAVQSIFAGRTQLICRNLDEIVQPQVVLQNFAGNTQPHSHHLERILRRVGEMVGISLSKSTVDVQFLLASTNADASNRADYSLSYVSQAKTMFESKYDEMAMLRNLVSRELKKPTGGGEEQKVFRLLFAASEASFAKTVLHKAETVLKLRHEYKPLQTADQQGRSRLFLPLREAVALYQILKVCALMQPKEDGADRGGDLQDEQRMAKYLLSRPATHVSLGPCSCAYCIASRDIASALFKGVMFASGFPWSAGKSLLTLVCSGLEMSREPPKPDSGDITILLAPQSPSEKRSFALYSWLDDGSSLVEPILEIFRIGPTRSIFGLVVACSPLSVEEHLLHIGWSKQPTDALKLLLLFRSLIPKQQNAEFLDWIGGCFILCCKVTDFKNVQEFQFEDMLDAICSPEPIAVSASVKYAARARAAHAAFQRSLVVCIERVALARAGRKDPTKGEAKGEFVPVENILSKGLGNDDPNLFASEGGIRWQGIMEGGLLMENVLVDSFKFAISHMPLSGSLVSSSESLLVGGLVLLESLPVSVASLTVEEEKRMDMLPLFCSDAIPVDLEKQISHFMRKCAKNHRLQLQSLLSPPVQPPVLDLATISKIFHLWLDTEAMKRCDRNQSCFAFLLFDTLDLAKLSLKRPSFQRCITLFGPPGSGKSQGSVRAVQALTDVLCNFNDGFVQSSSSICLVTCREGLNAELLGCKTMHSLFLNFRCAKKLFLSQKKKRNFTFLRCIIFDEAGKLMLEELAWLHLVLTDSRFGGHGKREVFFDGISAVFVGDVRQPLGDAIHNVGSVFCSEEAKLKLAEELKKKFAGVLVGQTEDLGMLLYNAVCLIWRAVHPRTHDILQMLEGRKLECLAFVSNEQHRLKGLSKEFNRVFLEGKHTIQQSLQFVNEVELSDLAAPAVQRMSTNAIFSAERCKVVCERKELLGHISRRLFAMDPNLIHFEARNGCIISLNRFGQTSVTFEEPIQGSPSIVNRKEGRVIGWIAKFKAKNKKDYFGQDDDNDDDDNDDDDNDDDDNDDDDDDHDDDEIDDDIDDDGINNIDDDEIDDQDKELQQAAENSPSEAFAAPIGHCFVFFFFLVDF